MCFVKSLIQIKAYVTFKWLYNSFEVNPKASNNILCTIPSCFLEIGPTSCVLIQSSVCWYCRGHGTKILINQALLVSVIFHLCSFCLTFPLQISVWIFLLLIPITLKSLWQLYHYIWNSGPVILCLQTLLFFLQYVQLFSLSRTAT